MYVFFFLSYVIALTVIGHYLGKSIGMKVPTEEELWEKQYQERKRRKDWEKQRRNKDAPKT